MSRRIDARHYVVEDEERSLVWARLAAFSAIPGVMFAPVFWLIGRLRRAAWEAHAVETSPTQFGWVHERAEAARAAFGLDAGSVRVFVVNDGSYNIGRMPIGERRYIVVPGGLIDDGPTVQSVQELDFLFGRFMGAFQLRHDRFGPFEFMIAAQKIPVVGLLIRRWNRAAVLTGDRVGLAYAQNTDAALRTLAKLTVGRSADHGYSTDAHVEQAERLRRDFFHHWMTITSHFPPMPDRVADLRGFATDGVRASAGVAA